LNLDLKASLMIDAKTDQSAPKDSLHL